MQNTNEPVGFNPARPKELGPDYGRGNFQSSAKPGSSTQGSPSAQDLGDQAMSAGRDVAGRARDAASATADAVRTQAADLAAQGRDKFMEKAQGQKQAGAEYISGLAEAVRRAAGEFDKNVPFAATYIRTAASGIDDVAETVRNGNFSELMTRTQNFARRQPTLFVGLSMLAGFGVARLLKGSAAPMLSGSGQSGLTSSPPPARYARGAGFDERDNLETSGGTAGVSGVRPAAGADHGTGM